MIKRFFIFALAALLFSCTSHKERVPAEDFIRIEGQNLVRHGERFFIRGTNLGNWLNPEGYMFGFRKTNSASWIDRMFRELAGPDFTDEFWKNFKDRYITHADIAFIASTGANTIRLPFHYKLFTEEDYMGLTTAQDGFDRIDSVVAWCRREGLYVILDMHDAPGGQTGDNIDDSHGYPWLFESPVSEQLFYDIWVRIADRYKNEPVILGYDLLNEPIAPYFSNKDSLNTMLEPLYKRAVARIRQVDTNHIVILGAPQWNSNFDPFTDWSFDDKIIYSCHRYGGDATAEAIAHFIEFRNKTDLPMYMGEIGHNTPEWMKAFCKVMEDNNIGYTFWPYKKMGGSCFVSVGTPENWDQVVAFSEAPRDTYAAIREARPDQELIRLAMTRFLELCLFENCRIEEDYIRALCLDKERTDN